MSEENINTESRDSGAILDILSKLMPSKAPAENQEPTSTGDAPAPDFGALSSILSNPELISKLPELLSIISPMVSSLSGTARNAASPASAKPNAPLAALPQNREAQNRSALLCALKPYLKRERQDAIDYMIKLSRLGDILKTL